MVGACYAGSPQDGIDIIRPLKEFGSPIVDLLEPKPYVALQSMSDPAAPHGWHYYWKSVELPPLTDEAIDTLVEHASAVTSPKSYCIVFQLGGALNRVGAEETAYSQRDAAHNVNINAVWTEDDPEPGRHIAWARDFFDALAPRDRARLPQLPRRRRPGPRARGLRRAQLRAARATQAGLRPDQLLPPQPEHPARLTSSSAVEWLACLSRVFGG